MKSMDIDWEDQRLEDTFDTGYEDYFDMEIFENIVYMNKKEQLFDD